MVKDKRHKTIKLLIESDNIKRFSEIFDHIPVTVIAKLLGTNFVGMRRYIKDPKLLTFAKAIQLAQYFEVDEQVMISLVHKQIVANREQHKPGGRKAK